MKNLNFNLVLVPLPLPLISFYTKLYGVVNYRQLDFIVVLTSSTLF